MLKRNITIKEKLRIIDYLRQSNYDFKDTQDQFGVQNVQIKWSLKAEDMLRSCTTKYTLKKKSKI